jgi:GTPase SAR1 family protein
MFSRGAEVALVVFDLTSIPSFQNVRLWASHVRENQPTCQIYLIGNKSDLPARPIPIEQVHALVHEIGAVTYVETSALTGQGIPSLFEQLADNRPAPPALSDVPPVAIDDVAPAATRKNRCSC